MREARRGRESERKQVMAGLDAEPNAQTVRDALENLYHNVELANSSLATHFPHVQAIPDIIQRAQTLRNLLLDAIEGLRPLRPAPPHVLAARSYEVLSLRYVSGLSVEEVAEQMAVGERQVYRDLRHAEEELAEILHSRAIASPEGPAARKENAFQAELAVLEAVPQAVDLADSLQEALDTIRPLATQRHIRLDYAGPVQGVTAMLPPGILKQVLVQILSAVAQSTEGQALQVKLDQQEDLVRVRVTLPAPEPLARADLLQAALRLAQSIGLACQVKKCAPGLNEVILSLHTAQPLPVLVVEDNPGACELYQRYLQGSEWQAIPAPNPRMAEDMARSLHPAAIILDLLMPEVDGWSVLQALQLSPDTRDIPVIVCSVVDDPELATALGAAASLKKPVSRLELLGTLKRVARPRSAA